MKTLFAMAAVGAAFVGFAGTANAATMLEIGSVTSTNSSYRADLYANGVTGNGYSNSWDNNVSISPQTITGTLNGVAVTLTAFCLELSQYSDEGSFTVKTLADYLGSSTNRRYDAITGLVNNFAVTSRSALGDAATQVAIWEAYYEKSSKAFNVTKDDFKGKDWSNSLIDDKANALLNGLSGVTIDPNLQLFVATNKYKQDLLFFVNTAPVPEPATWAMMIMGLGLVGASMRRRAGRTTVSFA